MEFREKTPEERLLTKIYSIEGRLKRQNLSDDERKRAQGRLNQAKQKLTEFRSSAVGTR